MVVVVPAVPASTGIAYSRRRRARKTNRRRLKPAICTAPRRGSAAVDLKLARRKPWETTRRPGLEADTKYKSFRWYYRTDCIRQMQKHSNRFYFCGRIKNAVFSLPYAGFGFFSDISQPDFETVGRKFYWHREQFSAGSSTRKIRLATHGSAISDAAPELLLLRELERLKSEGAKARRLAFAPCISILPV